MSKRLRVGVIGVGVMGENHVRIYSHMDNVDLIGISDIDKLRAEEIANKYNTVAYFNYIELLEQKLDAVSIVVPTIYHKDVAIDAIKYRSNILIEKPITGNIDDALTIINASNNAGIKLLVGHIERFNPAVLKLKEIVDSCELGKVVSIYARRVGPIPIRIKDVGIITDLGVHDIDIISYIYGSRIKELYTIAGSKSNQFEDHASIILRFNDNCSGIIDTNWLTPHKVRTLTITGFEKIACIDYIKQIINVYGKNEELNISLKKEEPLVKELQHFIDIILNNKKPLVSGNDGIYALEVAIAAINSYKNCCIVKL